MRFAITYHLLLAMAAFLPRAPTVAAIISSHIVGEEKTGCVTLQLTSEKADPKLN